VANLAPGTQRLAVNVEVRIGNCENLAWLGSSQLNSTSRSSQSARIAERQTGHGAKMVFQLAGDRAFDRPMAGIVNARRISFASRRRRIQKVPSRAHQHNQVFEDPPRSILCFALQSGCYARSRRKRKPQIPPR